MRVLFIGGTGIISSATGQRLHEQGHDLTLLTRGQNTTRPAPDGVRQLTGDATNVISIAAAIENETFDVVVNFRAFEPAQVAADIEFFRGRTGHYIFISSASAYTKPLTRWPIREDAPIGNPIWDYSQAKAECEQLLRQAWEDTEFPMTIVRPSHTYDRTAIPLIGGWTAIDRMRRGLPTLVHGDGTSLWTLTHTQDFAVGLAGLAGNERAIGEAFHITSEDPLTWDQITDHLAAAAGVEAQKVHVPSDVIAQELPDLGPGLLGDKSHSLIFDNSKLRDLVPDFAPSISYEEGAREVIDWFDRNPDQQKVDSRLDADIDRVLRRVRPAD